MLIIFFQNSEFTHKSLFLWQFFISVGCHEYYNNYKWLGILAT